jgi:putative NADH-flavin reductase
MKIVEDPEELKRILLKEKEKYLGKILETNEGRKFLIVEITEGGIQSFSIEELLRVKNLKEFLEEYLPPEKVKEAVEEIDLLKREIDKIYF